MNPKQENHSFAVSVAEGLAAIGAAAIEKAIILKEFYNLCSWRLEQNKTAFGLGWWYASAENLHKKFPYMNSKNIQRWLKELEKQGFVYSRVMNKIGYDRTKSYTVNYNAYNAIAQNNYSITQNEQWISQIEQSIAQNEQPIHSPNNSTNISTKVDKSKNSFLPPTPPAKSSISSLENKKEEKEKKVAPKKEKEQLTEQEQELLNEANLANEQPSPAEVLRTSKPFDINDGVFHALRVFGAARQGKAKSKRMSKAAWQRMISECQKSCANFEPPKVIELIETAKARGYQSPFFNNYQEYIDFLIQKDFAKAKNTRLDSFLFQNMPKIEEVKT